MSEYVPKEKSSKTRGIYCCVFQCTECTTKSKLTFFCVIRAKNDTQTEAWRRAINRIDVSGNPWSPKAGSRICSKHFITGKPSNDSKSPDYVPSLLMGGKRNASNKRKAEQSINRYERVSID